MILMALDHTRDFFGQTGFSPTDPTQTTIPLFFHALDHAFLRASFLSAHGHRRVSLAPQEVQTRVVAVSVHSGPVADLP
jgi:hypothetical protein